jgi:hypothetical protein
MPIMLYHPVFHARVSMRRCRAVLPLVLTFAAASARPVSAQATAPLDAEQQADSVAIAALAHRLAAHASTDSAKAAALYEWLARNVGYDVPRYLAGDIAAQPPEQVYRTRVAVCSGYAALYQRLAAEIGLGAEIIYGYAKGFDYASGQSTSRTNHAWLAVSVAGEWRLVDPTWGAGAVHDGAFVPAFSWDYFLVDPNALVLSHFPKESRWQLLRQPMRRREFERLPAVPRTLLGIGFSPDEIREAARRDNVRDFPLVGEPAPGLRVLQAPLTGTLPAASPVAVEIVWPDAVEVAFVAGDRYTRLVREGDRFRGATSTGSTPLFVVGRTDPAAGYRTLLLYQVR